MASQNPSPPKLYPEVIDSNPESSSPFITNTQKNKSSSSMYPTIDMKDLAENLFPETENSQPNQNSNFVSLEEVIVQIPGAIVHLIDKERSIELASGEFEIVQLKQGDNVVAVLARVGDQIQWPLARDEAAVKLDESHYFFTLRVPSEANDEDGYAENLLNYGLTIASKGQERLLKELDLVLEKYSAFRVEKVKKDKGVAEKWWMAPKDVSPEEMEKKKEDVERSSAAYWTTLAPNVEDYSSSIARMIAAGSGQLIKGILWCGDITVDRLKWGNDVLMKRMGKGSNSEISPEAMRRMKRVKKMTKMSEKVATGILSGVVKVSGFFTSSIANSKADKVCDAVEVAGKNVMSTTSVVTTGLVQQRHGDQAAQMTREGFDAAGHALGTAWAVFKIRQALNPKGAIKPTTVAKAAAQANLAKLKSKQK